MGQSCRDASRMSREMHHPDGRQLHDMADSREEKVYRSQGWGGRRVMIAEARHAQQDEVW
jgi:hypothetical protein